MTDSVFLIGVFVLVILCAGKPDLLDAIIGMVSQCGAN